MHDNIPRYASHLSRTQPHSHLVSGVYLLTRSSPPPSDSTTSPTSPTQSHTPTQATPLLPKSPPHTRSSSLAAKHRNVTRRSSTTSLNIVGLSPGPYLLLATPGASPGVVAVPVRDGGERERERAEGRRTRSRSRSTVRDAGR